MVKEKCEEDQSEVKKTETVRASELRAGNTMREQASCHGLLSLLWLMSRQKEAPLYNGCWQSSCLTNLCFDSAHCFQRTAHFLFSLFVVRYCRCVSVVSFTLSRLPLGFPLIPAAASVWITAPRHVHRPEQASCCLLYLWTAALNIYILRSSRGVRAMTSVETFPHWKIYDCLTREKLLMLILWPQLKKVTELSQLQGDFLSEQFHFHCLPTGNHRLIPVALTYTE